MSKSYQVKVYNETGDYLTTWQDYTSDISFNNEINSAGGQLQLSLARNAGDYGEGTDVDFNHQIKVYCFDKENPDGLIVFQGYISAYTPIYKDNRVEVTVLGFGSEFEKYMLQEPIDLANSVVVESGVVTGRKAPTYGANSTIGGDKDGAGDYFITGVKFTTPASMTAIPQIDVCFHSKDTYTTPTDTALDYPTTLTLYPISGTYPDYSNPLGSVTLPAGTSPNHDLEPTSEDYDIYYAKPVVFSFVFDDAVDVSSSTSYVFTVEAPTGSTYNNPALGYTEGDTWCEWVFDNSAYILDSYSEANRSADVVLHSATQTVVGQSFISAGGYLTGAVFNISKTGSPTGNATAYLFTHSGSYGTSSIGGTVLATSTGVSVAGFGALALQTFTFATPYLMTAGSYYFIAIEYTGGNSSNKINISYDGTSPTHGGCLATREAGSWSSYGSGYDLCFYVYAKSSLSTSLNYYKYRRSGSTTEAYSGSNKVIPFAVYQLDGTTAVSYLSQDPAVILKDVINKYNFLGGNIEYDDASIDLTGTEVSYDFNTATILEAVQKVIELCPQGWYWYIDQSTNLIHLHEKNVTPDHTFSLEKDLADAKFEKRIEDLINTIYFTGGGDPSLYRKFQNLNSVTKYGIKSMKYNDTRVTLSATAETIANSILETKSEPELRVTLEIIDSNNNQELGYDIESTKVGDVVAVRNVSQQVGLSTWDISRFDEGYWDFNVYNLSSLQMQVQKLDYTPDKLTIYASTMAVDVNKRIEDINRNLEALQTTNNPDAPS